MKENKGVTLAALVITIIVMLILAGVTIGTVVNEGGVIDISKKEAARYDAEVIRKSLNFAVLSAIKAGNGTITEDNLNKYLIDQFGDGKYTLTSNVDPVGFKVTIDTHEFVTTLDGEITELVPEEND